MACSTSAQSSEDRQIGPGLSMVQLKPIAPYRLTLPYVGRKPTTPQVVEGEIMEPSVSVPSEKPTSPADVHEADPAEEPLDGRSVFHGFLVMPANHRPPCASAPIQSLASSTAPCCSSRSTTVAL